MAPGFAGFATWLDMTPAHPDLFGMPDPSALIQLPWKKDVAWVAADCVMDDKHVAQAPRVVLKNVLAKAAKRQGLYVKTGVECEFFLTNADGTAISDIKDNAVKPCYDQQALMRRYDVISEICDYMLELGWGPYQNDHEDANGQFEMNWNFDDALVTADRHSFFKFMAKSIAEKHGLRATFMPKPFPGLTGNGCHAHISVWDKAGTTNMFLDGTDEMGLSQQGYQFPRRHHAPRRGARRHHQPDRQLLQAHQCAAHDFGRHVVAEHGDVDRQQPHAHGARAWQGPLRAAPAGRRGEPVPAAGRHHCRRPQRHRTQGAPRAPLRHRHVPARAHGDRRAETAAQPARCPAQFRQGHGAESTRSATSSPTPI